MTTTETSSGHLTPDALDGLDEQQQRNLERARELLKRAEHNGTTAAEAEACTEKAYAILRKYRIDKAMIDMARGKTEDLSTVITRMIKVAAPYAKESAVLLNTIANHLSCQALILTTEWRKGVRVAVYGLGDDPELVELLFTSLRVQATGAMLAAKGRSGEDLATFRGSFMRGFTEALSSRFSQIRENARAAEDAVAHGQASIALRTRAETVAAYIRERFPALGSVDTGRCSGSGSGAGYAAGSAADIGTGAMGGNGNGSGGRAALPR